MCSLPECWGEGKLCEAGISTWAHKNVASFVASKSEAKNTAQHTVHLWCTFVLGKRFTSIYNIDSPPKEV